MNKKPLSEILRQAIMDSPQNRRQISISTGIDAGVLSRFVRGERSIRLETVDLLAEHLGLVLIHENQAKEISQRKRKKPG